MFKFDPKPEIPFPGIEAKAKLDGHQTNGPTREGLPNAISRVKQIQTEYRNKQLERAQSELHVIQESVDTERDKIGKDGVKNVFLSNSPLLQNFNLAHIKQTLNQKKENYIQRNLDFIKFKTFHGLAMMPIRHHKNMTGTYALIAFLLIGEATINAIYFTPIVGIAVAYTLSLSQAVTNILTCYIVAAKIVPRVFFSEGVLRFVYGAIFTLHVVFIVWLNLALGLYRALALDDPMNVDMAPEKLKMALMPFTHLNEYTMDSALVAVVGFVLALLAYLKGYYSDDPHPGYGERCREAEVAYDELNSYKDEVGKELVSIDKELSDVTVKVHAYGTEAIKKWSASVNELEKIFVDYDNLLKILCEEYKSCQKTYSKNFNANYVNASGEPNPLNLNDELFSKSDFDLQIVFSDVYHYFLKDADRERKREDLTTVFEENCEKARVDHSEQIKKIKEQIENLLNQSSSWPIGQQEPL